MAPDRMPNRRRQDHDRTPTVVDLAPLTDLIERQAQELQRLTEAATMWQMRARQFEERTVWGAGDGSTLSVHPTPLGRVGGLICWENYMPLARYHQYAQGVQVYTAVTVDDSPSWQHLMRTIAAEGRVHVIATCQRFARSQFPDEPFLSGFAPEVDVLSSGGSMIVAPGGEVLAGPLEDKEGILTAEIDLEQQVAEKHSLDVTGHYARPDIFQLTVEEGPELPYQRQA